MATLYREPETWATVLLISLVGCFAASTVFLASPAAGIVTGFFAARLVAQFTIGRKPADDDAGDGDEQEPNLRIFPGP